MKKSLIFTFGLLLLPIVFGSDVAAATLNFAPNSGELTDNCEQSVRLRINTEGQPSNASDVIINFNPAQISVLDSNSSTSGTQIENGNAYETYFINEVNQGAGTITVATGSFVNDLNGQATYATIEFINKPGQTQADFSIEFTAPGNTYDSNIADSNTSLDLLYSVGTASFTFVEGVCSTPDETPDEDIIPPLFIHESPLEYGQVMDNTIIFIIRDEGSGIDIDSLIFSLNGTTLTPLDESVQFTGDPAEYRITITLDESEASNEIRLLVEGMDFANNALRVDTLYNVQLITPGPQTIIPDNIIGGTFLDNTIVDSLVEDIGLPGTSALLTGTIFLTSLIPLLSFLNAPGFLINILGLLLGRRVRKPWGIVTDKVTGKAIPFAACRIYTSGTTNLVYQTVSDPDGRYGFLIGSGAYRLEITHSDYTKHVGEIRIHQDQRSYLYDIQLSPKALDSEITSSQWNSKIKSLRIEIFAMLGKVALALGVVLSLISVITYPMVINYIILGLYVFVVIVILARKIDFRPKFAAIIDSNTKLRIPYAAVKIFDLTDMHLIDTQVTNNNGQFDYWGKPGTYGIRAEIRGYNFPSNLAPKSEIIETQYNELMKVNLKKGRNKIQIFVDPLESATSPATNDIPQDIPQGNLATPFS